jgi:hypothetical protein
MKFSGKSARVHRRVPRTLAAGSFALGTIFAISGGVLGFSGGSASATTAYTWSGADSSANQVPNWSDPANWNGNSAPQPAASVNLNFPDLACSSPCGNNGQNDVAGLKVKNFSLALGEETNNGDYSMSGNGIKLGVLDVTTSGVPNGQNGQNAYFGMPISLSGAETWSVDIENNSNLNLGTVTGADADSLSVSLPVSTPGNGGGFLNFPSINAGPLTFTASGGSYITGGNFNGTSKEPVTLKSVGVFVIGPGGTTKATTITYWGPLTATGSNIYLGNGSSGPFGINDIAGAASFKSKTSITFNSLEPGTGSKPVAGVDYPQIDATGAVTLGSPNLGLPAGCGQTIGTKYTLVTGSSITGTFKNLANNDIFEAGTDGSSSCQQPGAVGSYFQIKYTSTAVTVTVVNAPAGAPRTSARLLRAPVLRKAGGHYFRSLS